VIQIGVWDALRIRRGIERVSGVGGVSGVNPARLPVSRARPGHPLFFSCSLFPIPSPCFFTSSPSKAASALAG